MDIQVRTGEGTFAIIPPVGVGLDVVLRSYADRIKRSNVVEMTFSPDKDRKDRKERIQLLKERDLDALAAKINRHVRNRKTVILTLH